MQLIREKVYAMEQTHMNLKQKYVYPSISIHIAPLLIHFDQHAYLWIGMRKKLLTCAANSSNAVELRRAPWPVLPNTAVPRSLRRLAWATTSLPP